MAGPPDPSIPLCEIIEQEYAAITGAAPDPPPAWEFAPDQILEPERLASRLVDGHDRAARALALAELEPLVARLRARTEKGDTPQLREMLVEGFNAILSDADLYAPGKQERFAGVRFRSQTVDRLGSTDIVQRNRLILEDTFF